jgi:hypothetical protein
MIDLDRWRASKRRSTSTGPARADAWSRSAMTGTIVAVLVTTGALLYGVNKTITSTPLTDGAATPAPRTTGEGSTRQ